MTIYKGKIAGNLTLAKGDDATNVTSIGGSLYVRQGATCDLPQLTSIGGYLYVLEGATCDLPQLTSIGGSLDVRQGATCDVPQLTSIGGYPVPEPTVARTRLEAVALAALAGPGLLKMDRWHSESKGCGTSHCIAGWAVHLEPGGYDLEAKVGSTALAGNILLGPEYSKLFYLDQDAGLSALRRVHAGLPPLEVAL